MFHVSGLTKYTKLRWSVSSGHARTCPLLWPMGTVQYSGTRVNGSLQGEPVAICLQEGLLKVSHVSPIGD